MVQSQPPPISPTTGGRPPTAGLSKHVLGEHISPAYAENFKCIASACEDTCCRGWSVPIDQASYERYRSHVVLSPFVGKLITINTNAASSSDYARMPLTSDGACGFMDEQRLCAIQKSFGADLLSVTCATYPRAILGRSSEPEIALNLSCPEAARTVLLDPSLLASGSLGSHHGLKGTQITYDVHWLNEGKALEPGEIRLAIRDFVLTLLSDRRYPLWQRLYLLGPLIRRLQVLAAGASLGDWCEANPVLVLHALADSAANAAGQRLRFMMNEIEQQPGDRLQLVTEILRLRLAEPPTPPRFTECIRDFELGLRTNSAQTEEEILGAYAEGQQILERLLKEQPQLIENYLLNHVFKNNFPFGRQRLRPLSQKVKPTQPEDEHVLLCVLAMVAQTLLIGMAAHYGSTFGISHVVKLIQSLAKAIEHGTTFPATLADFVQKRGIDAILIRSAKPATSAPLPSYPQPSPVYLPRMNPSHQIPAQL